MTRAEVEFLVAICKDTKPGTYWRCSEREVVRLNKEGVAKVCVGDKSLLAIVYRRGNDRSALGKLLREQKEIESDDPFPRAKELADGLVASGIFAKDDLEKGTGKIVIMDRGIEVIEALCEATRTGAIEWKEMTNVIRNLITLRAAKDNWVFAWGTTSPVEKPGQFNLLNIWRNDRPVMEIECDSEKGKLGGLLKGLIQEQIDTRKEKHRQELLRILRDAENRGR